MNTTSQFTSNFWNIYIAAIVVLSFVGLAWLLLSQNKTKMPPKGEDVKTIQGLPGDFDGRASGDHGKGL